MIKIYICRRKKADWLFVRNQWRFDSVAQYQKKNDRIDLYGRERKSLLLFSGTWWLLTSGARWRHPMNSDSDDPETAQFDPTDPLHFSHSAPLEAGGSIHWWEVSSKSGGSSPLQQKLPLTSPSIPLLTSLFAILDRTNFASHLRPSSTSL